jgi:hypothetical protein
MEPCTTIAEGADLQDVNRRLQALVVRLARIVVARIAEAGPPPDGIHVAEINDATRRLETVSTLRDLALECAHLARHSPEMTFARELEEIGVELADAAARLEASLKLD